MTTEPEQREYFPVATTRDYLPPIPVTPTEPERTPLSRGFYFCVISWSAIIVIYLLSVLVAPLFRHGLCIMTICCPVSVIWTMIDAIEGEKWGLLGLVLATLLPAAFIWLVST